MTATQHCSIAIMPSSCMQGLLGIGSDPNIHLFYVSAAWRSDARGEVIRAAAFRMWAEAKFLLPTFAPFLWLSCEQTPSDFELQEINKMRIKENDFPDLLSFLGPCNPGKTTVLGQHIVGLLVAEQVSLLWDQPTDTATTGCICTGQAGV